MALMQNLKIPTFACWVKRAVSAVNPFKSSQITAQPQCFKQLHSNCPENQPTCGVRFHEIPCERKQVNIKIKQPHPRALPAQERSIRIKRSPKCCGNPCPDALPRFDLLYYKRTNKLLREYQQTWDECPEPLRRPRPRCSGEIQPAKFKKRPRQQRPQTACPQDCETTKAICPYIGSIGCRPARHPPSCKWFRPKLICKKRPSPTLAFSECAKRLPKIRPVECRCLLAPSICEVWSYHHYLARIHKLRSC